MPRVLKSPPPADNTELAPFAFDDLGQQARNDLLASRRQAEELLTVAGREAERIRRQAEEQGRATAQQAAEAAAAQSVARQVETLLPALRQAVADIEAAKDQWRVHWERSALAVATAIAARVIRREVERTPDITLSLVREALELAAGTTEIQLRLHPEDYASLGGAVERLVAEVGRLGTAAIVADASITRGGCRIDTRHGTIDQQFEAQLDRIAQELS